MNFRLLSKLLGILALLIGGFMLFSLVWADPGIGAHTDVAPGIAVDRPESNGVWGLIYSALICWLLGGTMYWYGRDADTKIYRKEAMAVVGLSWVLATMLGALPYMLSGTCRGPSIRVFEEADTILVSASRLKVWKSWETAGPVTEDEMAVLGAIASSDARGMSQRELVVATGLFDAPAVFRELNQRFDVRVAIGI